MGKFLIPESDRVHFAAVFQNYVNARQFNNHQKQNVGAACLKVAQDLIIAPASTVSVTDVFVRIIKDSSQKRLREMLTNVLLNSDVDLSSFSRRLLTDTDTDIFVENFVKEAIAVSRTGTPVQPSICDVLLNIHNRHVSKFSASYLRAVPTRIPHDVGSMRRVAAHFRRRIWPQVSKRIAESGRGNLLNCFPIKSSQSGTLLSKKKLNSTRKCPCKVDSILLKHPQAGNAPVGLFLTYEQYLSNLILVRNSSIPDRFGHAMNSKILKNTFTCMVVVGHEGNLLHAIDYVPTISDNVKVSQRKQYLPINSEHVLYPYVINEERRTGEFAYNLRIRQPVLKTKLRNLSYAQFFKLATVGNGVYVGLSTLGIPGCNGLFAETDFAKDQIITAYMGWTMSERVTSNLMEIYRHGFIKRMSEGHYVDGLRIPLKGIPGAQFANHAEKTHPSWNAELVVLHVNQINEYVVIRATRDIANDQEIFCCYGNGNSLIFEK